MHGSTGGFFLSHGAIGNHPKDGPFTYMDALCFMSTSFGVFFPVAGPLGGEPAGAPPGGRRLRGGGGDGVSRRGYDPDGRRQAAPSAGLPQGDAGLHAYDWADGRGAGRCW